MTIIKEPNWLAMTLNDPFLFATVMEDKPTCQQVIETLLDIQDIVALNYLEVEKTLDVSYDSKGVRLDVYVKDHLGVAYAIEMQTANTYELHQRARYYGAIGDVDQGLKGQDYKDLKKSYVIFICCEDIFKLGYYRYAFENMCTDVEGLKLNDGTYKIFFNTKGHKGVVSKDVKDFLKYVEGIESTNPFVQAIAHRVEAIKEREQWRRWYMTKAIREQDLLDRGIHMGEERKAIQVAQNFLQDDLPIEMIAKNTGLSIEAVEKLRDATKQKL